MVVLWSAASYREAKTTERWHSEMEEKRRRRPKADRRPQLSSLYEAAGLWRGHPPVLFLLPSLDGGGGRVMKAWGESWFLFYDAASDDKGGPAPPTPPADVD